MGSPLVVVPVFGRLDVAGRALRALDAHTPGDVTFLVVDDCGPERVVEEWLDWVLKPSRVRLLVLNEENLGFVRSANVAFALRNDRDVVVVNSDVVVYAGWLGHLQAAAGPGIASVTALSNNGSIATMAAPTAFEDVESLSVAAAQADATPPPPYDLPVGVGHCIYLTNTALAEVGVFDEAFSPGYGEEVDWSIRARRLGWRHLAAPGVIVWHDAGASFGQRRLLVRRHELRLAMRYPREFLALRLRRLKGPRWRPLRDTSLVDLSSSTTILNMADRVITDAADPQSSQESLINQLSGADTLTDMPAIVDVARRTPPNPPAHIQEQFVGHSYEAAYSEAFSFMSVVSQWSTGNGRGELTTLDRILDFGSGWGRITRVLLTRQVHPRKILAADVDQDMTALVNVTLPGITALTVDPMPPTFLNDATLDLVTAYSVFSHLSPDAHEAWAQEFGRLVADGGLVVLTVLDRAFFDQIQWSINDVEAGSASPAATSLAGAFPDLKAAVATFDQGGIAYAGTGGGGVRTGDFYGWAAAPKQYIEHTWGAAGFDIVQWVPSGRLFEQAAVALRRRTRTFSPASAFSRAARASASKVGLRRK